MPLLDLEKMTAGLSRTWSGYLRDWDRSLRAGNYPETTRYNYLLAAAQRARYLGEYSPDPDAEPAADDPVEVTRGHVESFQEIDLTTESVHFHGKGSRDRRVRFGPRTARAVSRYLRARAKDKAAHLPDLWLAERGVRRLAPNASRSCSSAGALRPGW
ncbi:hypothetical protein ABT173_05650 [Streptomyces sp. NPDC001795]|uniref:hypothetical protein n=1 Tax=Streptomyces sp. NPDC001795 TaxID=3154525 RepID=UPI0033187FEB